MDRIWSPWRSQHVTNHAAARPPAGEEGSVFSRIAAAERDEDHFILWRGVCVFVVMNLYPYNNGHLMIVPYRQVARYDGLTEDEQIEMARTTAHCIRWLEAALRPEGYNTGMNLGEAGGAGIPDHVHLHVVPRWRGDTNFMPTVADVKVVPEALRETYDRLRAAVERLGPPPA